MLWTSNNITAELAKKIEHLLPKDFDYKLYIELNPDLSSAGIDNYQKAKEHYLFFGIKENRLYSKNIESKFLLLKSNSYEVWNNQNKNIMILAPTAPEYDSSGGGRRLYKIIELLKEKLNYNVYLFYKHISSKKHLKKMKDLKINTYQINKNIEYNLKQFKKDNINFDNVIFCWFDTAYDNAKIVKKYYPKIKIIVDSVDVHWVREQRGFDIGQLETSQNALDIRKNIEKESYSMANVVFCVTDRDRLAVEKEIGYNANIKILSSIHTEKNINLGGDIFFLGNYSHSPNIQACIESINIFNKFYNTKFYKNLTYQPKLLIAGANINDKIVSHINLIKNNNIKILGKIEDLSDLYKKSCLCLAPIYWGAGIKTKICDSAICGVPILTTDIGNEGIGFLDSYSALIANNENEFINKLIYFFTLSNKDQITIGNRGLLHIKDRLGEQAALQVLTNTLQEKHIVISIIAYKQTKKLKKCLESIFKRTKYSNYTIVISDNSSDPKIYKIIENFVKKYPNKIEYIKNKINQYFIEPNNSIMQNLKYLDSDIVLLNDDTEIISDGWLNYLYSTAYSASDVAAVGGKTLFPNHYISEAGAELYNDGDGKNLFRNYPADTPESDIRKSVGYCSGCLLYMRRDAINKIGVFDTNLQKMYYEDADWQYRAHLNGLKTIYEPRCLAIHDEGSSSGADINSGAKKYQKINKKIFKNKYKNINIEQYNYERAN